jgi:hypothetical protein
MGGVTSWVRKALQELGPGAPDAVVKTYIREREPSVPESQIGLALRTIRGAVVPRQSTKSSTKVTDD